MLINDAGWHDHGITVPSAIALIFSASLRDRERTKRLWKYCWVLTCEPFHGKGTWRHGKEWQLASVLAWECWEVDFAAAASFLRLLNETFYLSEYSDFPCYILTIIGYEKHTKNWRSTKSLKFFFVQRPLLLMENYHISFEAHPSEQFLQISSAWEN